MTDDTVCAWQGGFPQSVGEALGDEPMDSAVGGCLDGRYVLSVHGAEGWSLLVYDPRRGFWHREDELHALGFAALEGELYAIDADTGDLLALKGRAGEPEGAFDWLAQTGPLRYAAPDRQYLGRSATALCRLPTRRWAVKFRPDGLGVAFGKAPESVRALELPSDWDIRLGAESLWLRLHPVGSLLLADSAPGEGTWSQIGAVSGAALWRRTA